MPAAGGSGPQIRYITTASRPCSSERPRASGAMLPTDFAIFSAPASSLVMPLCVRRRAPSSSPRAAARLRGLVLMVEKERVRDRRPWIVEARPQPEAPRTSPSARCGRPSRPGTPSAGPSSLSSPVLCAFQEHEVKRFVFDHGTLDVLALVRIVGSTARETLP